LTVNRYVRTDGFLICSKQEELSQRGRLVESLRAELDSASEAKNEMENRYVDSLKETETLRKECDEARRCNELASVSFYVIL